MILPPPNSVPGPVRTPMPPPVSSVGHVGPASDRWYTVQEGDSLRKLAFHFYRAGADWPRIFNANHISVLRPDKTPGILTNQDELQPGWRLHIP